MSLSTSLNNPIVGNTSELSHPKFSLANTTQTLGENEIKLEEFMKTETFRRQILQIIRSLSKTEPKTLEEDQNPLDNIIRNEVSNFLDAISSIRGENHEFRNKKKSNKEIFEFSLASFFVVYFTAPSSFLFNNCRVQ